MQSQEFLQSIQAESTRLGLNPLLVLSGIEGLYSFRNQPAEDIQYKLLDSLILTLFALRIGDGFHLLAEKNLESKDPEIQLAAIEELTELPASAIAGMNNPYLQSFASVLQGKTPIRKYHAKALEVAALEINQVHLRFGSDSIGQIILHLCQHQLQQPLRASGIFQS